MGHREPHRASHFALFDGSTSHGRPFGVFSVLFALAIFFSLLDLSTTSIALARGMAEGNSLVLLAAAATGVAPIVALGVSKGVFLLLCGIACYIGMRASGRIATLAFVVLGLSVLVQAAVCVNNVYLLL